MGDVAFVANRQEHLKSGEGRRSGSDRGPQRGSGEWWSRLFERRLGDAPIADPQLLAPALHRLEHSRKLHVRPGRGRRSLQLTQKCDSEMFCR